MSLLYAVGERPTAGDVVRLLNMPGDAASQGVRVSHRPDESEGWLELLASGLTFDLSGLAPAAPSRPTQPAHLFGIPDSARQGALEAVMLAPGEHTAPGMAMLPIVRVMCGLGARLASLGSVKAVCWTPAQSWMEPRYFKRIIEIWLGGGAFPALGLAALSRASDSTLESRGLTFFTGQEVRVNALPGEPRATTAKLAIRMMDLMVRHGRVREAFDVPGPGGELLKIAPSPRGEIVLVHRGE